MLQLSIFHIFSGTFLDFYDSHVFFFLLNFVRRLLIHYTSMQRKSYQNRLHSFIIKKAFLCLNLFFVQSWETKLKKYFFQKGDRHFLKILLSLEDVELIYIFWLVIQEGKIV